ncbi:hypothetical protein BDB01DRAFT_722687 [Pilobolus umbonatus]|nr:hypothetical protein BDB01DRAFT_722687 [Pilobolus umbonatus]
MFHYHHLPVGEYFEKVLPLLTLNKVDMVYSIFNAEVNNYAHRADIVRLEALLKYGGIYLDLDLVTLKPIDHLLDKEFVMAQEGVDGSVGLCNAMMIARPQARFLQRWYASYVSFDDKNWSYHSVILPKKLASVFNDEITILNHTSFFWPLWDSLGLSTLYLQKTYDFSANLGTHLWESAANKNLMKGVSEDVIMNIDNSLYCQLRKFLLDGKEDPRAAACRIRQHSQRQDKMVGHWPLMEDGNLMMNPVPARDISGNLLNGQIYNGKYNEDGVYLPGNHSYVFLPFPSETSIESLTMTWWMKIPNIDMGKMAVAIQTDHGRLCVVAEDNALNIRMLGRNRNWTWVDMDTNMRASPYKVDDDFHHYALIVHSGKYSNRTADPTLTFMMDGYVIGSTYWKYPSRLGTLIRGVWLGSIEPLSGKYEDRWNSTLDLEAVYKDVRAWEKHLMLEDVASIYSESDTRPKKVIGSTKDKDEEEEEEAEVGRIEAEEEEEEDDDLQWAEEQLD